MGLGTARARALAGLKVGVKQIAEQTQFEFIGYPLRLAQGNSRGVPGCLFSLFKAVRESVLAIKQILPRSACETNKGQQKSEVRVIGAAMRWQQRRATFVHVPHVYLRTLQRSNLSCYNKTGLSFFSHYFH